jgi:putative transposase
VSSADQKEDPERQVQRLQAFVQEQGWTEVKAATEIGFGLNGKRKKLLRILRDPQVVRIVVEHRDRLARFGFDLLEAAMAASGRHVVVIEDGEVTDDLAQDVLEILTSACGRLDGRRSAGRRARPAWEASGMQVKQAFRFELDPNREARIALAKHVGAARFAYNWGLARCLEAQARGEQIPSAVDLHKDWNEWKRKHAPWWVEVSKCAPQEAFRDLERAVRNWREGRAGFPRFKRKKALADNKARLTGSIRVTPRHVQLPRIGKVRTKERTDQLLELLQSGKARILSATISREADRWFVSLTCEVERPDPEPREIRGPEDVVGIDVGLESFAVLSDGTRMEAPKPLAKALRLLKRRSKQLSRKQKKTVVEQDPETGEERKRTVFSRNYEKAALRLARLHRRVRNIRRDFLHKVTTELAKAKPVLVVEDLNVRGLARNGSLSRAILDVGWGAFRRMLEYKCAWYGAVLLIAPRDFPSTKRCSRCGWVAPTLPLSQRVFRCEACGLEVDRDLNAALNLRRYGLAALKGPTGSSPGSDACGDPSGGGTGKARSTSHGSMKQEAARHEFHPSG